MIKVGFLVSYDYDYLQTSIPLIYSSADSITLAIDKDGLTWSGNKIYIPQDFFAWVREIDKDNKIRIYKDNFYVPSNTPAQNDTRERNMLSEFMGGGGWHIQLDSDEYFVNFESFVTYLKSIQHYLSNPEKNPVQVVVYWINLFKKTDKGFLYIKDSYTPIEVATNYPKYNYMRVSNFKKIVSPFLLFHQSWARNETEIKMKISNWSHRDDANNIKFFDFWLSINENNFRKFHNFHPTDPKKWRSLDFVNYKDLFRLPIEIRPITIFQTRVKYAYLKYLRAIFGEEKFLFYKKKYQNYRSNRTIDSYKRYDKNI